MLRLLISVSLVNLIVSPVYGLITIESKPAKVNNGNYVKLICDVGTMKDTVGWVYGGVTYFSCEPPYSNCFTKTSSANDDGYYDFSMKDNLLIAIFLVRQDENDGNWSCYHGKEKDEFEIDNADSAKIKTFSSSRNGNDDADDEPGDYNVYYRVQSQIPVDVLIYTQSYQGKRILYDVKQSNISSHTFKANFTCSERHIYCNVTNGYGPTDIRLYKMYVRCPLKILYDMLPNTTVDRSYRRGSELIKIYYEGYPMPKWSLYNIGEDGIPVVYEGTINGGISGTRYNPTTSLPAYLYLYVYSSYKITAGKYILTLKQGNITKNVNLEFIYSKRTTASPIIRTSRIDSYSREHSDWKRTTASPKGISNIDPRKTTKRAEDTHENNMKRSYSMGMEASGGKMLDQIMIMLYLGVAGFVMTLVLFLILIIVGVFWISRRKFVGSVDPQKNPIIFTKV